MSHLSRRDFLRTSAAGLAAGTWALQYAEALAQLPGERPKQSAEVKVLNPRGRVPMSLIINPKTGRPYDERTLKFMENWDWSVGKSADEMAEYMAYALRILKNAGLPCEGITTPGGFGNRALPELAQGTLEAVRDVFGA